MNDVQYVAYTVISKSPKKSLLSFKMVTIQKSTKNTIKQHLAISPL